MGKLDVDDFCGYRTLLPRIRDPGLGATGVVGNPHSPLFAFFANSTGGIILVLEWPGIVAALSPNE